jgi:hypothetical protein
MEEATEALEEAAKTADLARKQAEEATKSAADQLAKNIGGGRKPSKSGDDMVAEKVPTNDNADNDDDNDKQPDQTTKTTKTTKVPIGDISHKSSSTPNPSAFDIRGYTKTAYKKARAVFPDAELVRIDADGVLPNGKANLKLDSGFSVLYRFQSRANAKRPKDLPLGVEHKPTCLYYVNVTAANVTAYGLEGWKCEMAYAGKPKCSTKQVWDQAIKKGAPGANAIANLWYSGNRGKNRWHFSIKETKFSWWIPDNC